MSVCKNCGAASSLNYPLCKNCWKAAQTDQAQALRAVPAVGPIGTPLEVACPYEWTFGPMEGQRCEAGPGQACTEGTYAPSIDVRMVSLGAAGRVEVHEARFAAWRAQPVKLV